MEGKVLTKKRKPSQKEGQIKRNKRQKICAEKHGSDNFNAMKFLAEVKKLLSSENTVAHGLKKLSDAIKSSNNQRSEALKEFLKQCADCGLIFKVLEEGRKKQSYLQTQLAVEVIEYALLFIAENEQQNTYKNSGMQIVHKVLQSQMKFVYHCLSSPSAAPITICALSLLTAMVTQGASAAREVQMNFDFSLKSLQSLPKRRDSKATCDVRTCFIHFALSFLLFGDSAVIKYILELKGFFGSIMNGLSTDPPDLVLVVISTLQRRVVKNAAILKKTKVLFFSAYVLITMTSLYNYDATKHAFVSEDDNARVKDAAHQLLLNVCSSFKFGICFANKAGGLAQRSNSPVLVRYLQSLPKAALGNLSLQELVVNILCCCPDVICTYLTRLQATYEPRLSMPWLNNINFVTKVYASLPPTSQMLKTSEITLTNSNLSTLVNMIVPTAIPKDFLKRRAMKNNYISKKAYQKIINKKKKLN